MALSAGIFFFSPTFDAFLKASRVGSFLTLSLKVFQRKVLLEENDAWLELFIFGLVAFKEFLFIECNLLAYFHEVSVM